MQRDWARKDTYDAVMNIVREHSGAYGMGVDYAYTMVHKAPERVKHGQRIGPNPAKKAYRALRLAVRPAEHVVALFGAAPFMNRGES